MGNRYTFRSTIHDPRVRDTWIGANVAQRLGVVLVGAALIVGCSGAASPTSGATGPTPTTSAAIASSAPTAATASPTPGLIGTTSAASSPPPGAISVETAPLSFAYEPSALTAAAGTVSFFISNAAPEGPKVGRRHNMAIGMTLGEALVESTSVEEGKAVTFTVQDLPSGDYLVFCTVLDSGTAHYDLGMKGTLTVTP